MELADHHFQGIQLKKNESREELGFFLHVCVFPLQDDSLTMERLNTYVVSASIENASIQNLNEPVTVTLHHIDQNRVGCVHFIRNGVRQS